MRKHLKLISSVKQVIIFVNKNRHQSSLICSTDRYLKILGAFNYLHIRIDLEILLASEFTSILFIRI